MSEYRVELENYAGPLDLLLYLVKRHEIDLYDIPIAQLTDQYLHHLEQMKQIDINVAGEFLVMAATLLEIKSQMLVPRGGEEKEGEDDGEPPESISAFDPRYELVQQLLAYKAYKDAANDLDDRRAEWSQRFAAVPSKPPKQQAGEDELDNAPPLELDLEDIGLHDLCEAFVNILESIGQTTDHQVFDDDTPTALHQEDIVDRLQRDGAMSLQRMFVGRRRPEMIGMFIAMLELIRQRRLRAFQDKVGSDIKLELRPPEDRQLPASDEATDWRNPETGEIEYEWPSEEAKQRAERRAERKLAMAKKRFAKDDEQTSDSEGDEEDDLIDLEDLDEPEERD